MVEESTRGCDENVAAIVFKPVYVGFYTWDRSKVRLLYWADRSDVLGTTNDVLSLERVVCKKCLCFFFNLTPSYQYIFQLL